MTLAATNTKTRARSASRSKKPTPAKKRTAKKAASKNAPSSNVINLRTDVATKALIDRAAAASGQNRTEFMLKSARAQAEMVLLDKVYFQLGDAEWNALNAALEAPPPANGALKAAFRSVPLWDRQ